MKRLPGELIALIVLSLMTISVIGFVSYIWYGQTISPSFTNGKASSVPLAPKVVPSESDSLPSPSATTSAIQEQDLIQKTGANRVLKCTSDNDCKGRFVYCTVSSTKFCQTTCIDGACKYIQEEKEELQ